MIVYLIKNKVTGTEYIGQTRRKLDRRWSQHCNFARNMKESPLYAAIREYGHGAFEVSCLDSAATLDDLRLLEAHYIKTYNTVHPNGYNLTAGGNGPGICSEETRKNMSLALMGNSHAKGFKHSEETRRKGSLRLMGNTYRRGKPATPETLAKMSAATKGRSKGPFSAEHCANISKGKRGKKLGKRKIPLSAESRAKISKTLTGRKNGPLTEEHRAKISASNMGKVMTAEARANMSKARRSLTACGKGHPYDEANVRLYRGRRVCRRCQMLYMRNLRQNKRMARSNE